MLSEDFQISIKDNINKLLHIKFYTQQTSLFSIAVDCRASIICLSTHFENYTLNKKKRKNHEDPIIPSAMFLDIAYVLFLLKNGLNLYKLRYLH